MTAEEFYRQVVEDACVATGRAVIAERELPTVVGELRAEVESLRQTLAALDQDAATAEAIAAGADLRGADLLEAGRIALEALDDAAGDLGQIAAMLLPDQGPPVQAVERLIAERDALRAQAAIAVPAPGQDQGPEANA